MSDGPRNDERWVPRCPRCGRGNPILAPANQHTRNHPDKLDVYCPECAWVGSLGDNIKQIYVRI